MDIMLLDNKRKFLFIHIPKTAGTSIRNNLATLTDLEKPYSELNKELKHKSGILLKKDIDNWNELYKFAFIRNPYDRMVSYWAFYRMPRVFPFFHQARQKAVDLSFTEWIKWLRKREFTRIGDHPPRMIPMWRRPQVDFLFDGSEKLVDYIGRFETLTEDYRYICKHLELDQSEIWDKNKRLQKFNYSKRLEDYRDYYDDESRSIVKWWFMRDIKEFDYRFF